MDVKKLQGVFVDEAMERLAEIENGLLGLEKSPDNKELLNTIFRAAHTIKGSGGTVGLKDISSFAHSMEEILDLMRDAKLNPAKELITVLLEATDLIKEMVECVASDVQFDFSKCNDLTKQMEEIRKGKGGEEMKQDGKDCAIGSGVCEKRTFKIIFIPDHNIFKKGIDPLIIIEDLKNIGEIVNIKAFSEDVPKLSDIDPEELYLRWDIFLKTDKGGAKIKEVFEFIEEGSEIKILPINTQKNENLCIGGMLVDEGIVKPEDVDEAVKSQKKLGEILVEQGKASQKEIENALEKQRNRKSESLKNSVSSTIRVDLKKLDHLINTVGEMVIINSMFQQTIQDKNSGMSERMDVIFSQLQRIGKAIQESAMSLRMLPVGDVFQRFARLVRELSDSKNKKIQLIISGEETELDKGVLEKITDPLVHIIRNSIDHGIETSEERLIKGKPEAGTIHLSAYQMGDSVYIDVEDDGKGLDKEKILEKAVSKEIINNTKGLTDEQIYDLIFLPGFSTADKVTDVSGRGVGMDVVKKNIDSLNGRVFIRTKPGMGTTISIKLPLTLAIIDGMAVLVGEETFILPITSVLESIKPNKEDVKTLAEKGEVVNVRGEFIPLIRLYENLNIKPWKKEPWNAIVVLVSYEKAKYCFLVDELLGQQQVVIKSLGRAIPKVNSISGGTILGDGRVALVLDVHGIVKAAVK
ncbi:MAG: chemotaxis protein CheA [Deltaproteobacteria bacterium]|nr:chemotaxis protein CheA [Deltaproteobacteria bacterium]